MIRPATNADQPAAPLVFQSDALGELAVPHGFATRWCEPARIAEVAGCSGRSVMRVQQVHGDAVLSLKRDMAVPDTTCIADAMVTDDPAVLLAIQTADCVPILLADGSGRVVAAVHAGWRGLVAGVLPKAIDRMTQEFNLAAGNLYAAVGPCISAEAYEVGEEVCEAMASAGLAAAIVRSCHPKPHVDLRYAARLQMVARGLNEAHVDVASTCTMRDNTLFHSYRRDGQAAGRQLSAIGVQV